MGDGWTLQNGQCVYSPTTEASTLDVASLGYGTELTGSTFASGWQQFFDPYDPTKEEMLGKAAGVDVGQLGEAWGLRGQQLGETWGLQRGELGAKAGLGFRQAKQAGTAARGKSGLAYSGTAAGMQRGAERDVMGQYGRGMQAGKSAYEQAMATGQLGLQQATTDIYQGLESDIYGERDRWQREQRSNLNTILGMDIWGEDNTFANAPVNCIGEGCIDTEGGTCPTGYYLPTPDSGLQGCQPTSGPGTPGPTTPPEFTNMTEADRCASKGGFWNGSTCDFEGP